MQIPALFKKRKGVLKITDDTLTWKQTDSANEISFPFQQIKTQMAHKTDKTLLKIVLITDESVQLRFESGDNRDVLVSLIKEKELKPVILDEFEIQARQDLLTTYVELGQIHKELVLQKVITEQEFWSLREHDLSLKKFMIMQSKGTSSMLTADVMMNNQGSQTEIKITADDIHAIFTQYPGVQKAFLNNVPTTMSETEFWTAYFQSKYFHRNRVGSVRESGKGDIFEKYMEMDNCTFINSGRYVTSRIKLCFSK